MRLSEIFSISRGRVQLTMLLGAKSVTCTMQTSFWVASPSIWIFSYLFHFRTFRSFQNVSYSSSLCRFGAIDVPLGSSVAPFSHLKIVSLSHLLLVLSLVVDFSTKLNFPGKLSQGTFQISSPLGGWGVWLTNPSPIIVRVVLLAVISIKIWSK